MPRLKNTPPTYRLHMLSGRAIVTFNGRDHFPAQTIHLSL